MNLETKYGSVELPDSVRNAEKAVKKFEVQTGGNRYVATVRWDDTCRNGHNSFSITCEEHEKGAYGGWRLGSCGCNHALVAKHFPMLAPLLKFHLFSSEGPLHYIANTMYLASDKDCWGYRKGEHTRNKAGELVWDMEVLVDGKVVSHGRVYGDAPKVEYQFNPVLGEGKERELEAARRTACWPEATDEDLMLPAVELGPKLVARLPAMMTEFKASVEALGFTY